LPLGVGKFKSAKGVVDSRVRGMEGSDLRRAKVIPWRAGLAAAVAVRISSMT
jgi:hypothetical protein